MAFRAFRIAGDCSSSAPGPSNVSPESSPRIELNPYTKKYVDNFFLQSCTKCRSMRDLGCVSLAGSDFPSFHVEYGTVTNRSRRTLLQVSSRLRAHFQAILLPPTPTTVIVSVRKPASRPARPALRSNLA